MYSGRLTLIVYRNDGDKDIFRFKKWDNLFKFIKKNRQCKLDDKGIKFEIEINTETATIYNFYNKGQ